MLVEIFGQEVDGIRGFHLGAFDQASGESRHHVSSHILTERTSLFFQNLLNFIFQIKI